MSTRRGTFVVLEGLDGSGTTTQAQMLRDALAKRRVRVALTHEPTDEPIGSLIRDALSGGAVSARTGHKIALSEKALCLLFAADRIEHSIFIEEERSTGTHVVSDRYVWSSIAYQSLDSEISAQRVVDVNAGVSVPDVTILLDVPVEVCLERLRERNDSPTVYERGDLLRGIQQNYESTRSLYETHFGPVHIVDGTLPVDAVHSAIIEIAEDVTSG